LIFGWTPSENEAMTIELTDEQKRMVDLAVASGAYHDPEEVIGTALAMLYEDIEDGIISDARAGEPVSVWMRLRRNSARLARSSDVV
jgi:Arc/MetJ-type ribon-helix-helix transcriptional regulator